MTNREQIAWALSFSDYEDSDVAKIISEMLDATNIAYMDSKEIKRLSDWMGLDCDKYNNLGVLPEFEDE